MASDEANVPLVRPDTCHSWAELKFGPRLLKWAHRAKEVVRNRRPEDEVRYERWKDETWKTMSDSSHSTLAWMCVTFILLCIVVSTGMFIIETIPEYEQSKDLAAIFFWSETGFVIIFTLEFILRFWSCPMKKLDFLKDPLNLIDLIAILPFWIELFMVMIMGSEVLVYDLRFLRAIRMIRLLKMGRYSIQLQLMGEAAVRSYKSFGILVAVLLLSVVFYSSVMWSTERGSWSGIEQCYAREGEVFFNACSPYESVPLGFWWAITTLTTVGYGDAFPITPLGRLVGGTAMLCAIVCVALPTAVLAEEFHQTYCEKKIEREKEVNAKTLKLRHMPELELYMSMQNFESLKSDLTDHMNYLKYLAQAQVEKDGSEVQIDPIYSYFYQETSEGLDNVKVFVQSVTDKLIV